MTRFLRLIEAATRPALARVFDGKKPRASWRKAHHDTLCAWRSESSPTRAKRVKELMGRFLNDKGAQWYHGAGQRLVDWIYATYYHESPPILQPEVHGSHALFCSVCDMNRSRDNFSTRQAKAGRDRYCLNHTKTSDFNAQSIPGAYRSRRVGHRGLDEDDEDEEEEDEDEEEDEEDEEEEYSSSSSEDEEEEEEDEEEEYSSSSSSDEEDEDEEDEEDEDEEDKDEDVFEFEKVLDRRPHQHDTCKGCTDSVDFLIRWKGYSSEHDSWVPSSRVQDWPAANADFELERQLGLIRDEGSGCGFWALARALGAEPDALRDNPWAGSTLGPHDLRADKLATHLVLRIAVTLFIVKSNPDDVVTADHLFHNTCDEQAFHVVSTLLPAGWFIRMVKPSGIIPLGCGTHAIHILASAASASAASASAASASAASASSRFDWAYPSRGVLFPPGGVTLVLQRLLAPTLAVPMSVHIPKHALKLGKRCHEETYTACTTKTARLHLRRRTLDWHDAPWSSLHTQALEVIHSCAEYVLVPQ